MAGPDFEDAFETHLAGVPEYAHAIVSKVLVQTQPRKPPRSGLASDAWRGSRGSRRGSWPSSSRRSMARGERCLPEALSAAARSPEALGVEGEASFDEAGYPLLPAHQLKPVTDQRALGDAAVRLDPGD